MPLIIEEQDLNHYVNSVFYQAGYVSWKNHDSTFLALSQECAQLLGYRHRFDVVGATDFELPCKASEHADTFRQFDRESLSYNHDRYWLEFMRFNSEWKLMHGRITVVQDSTEQALGIISAGQEITHHPMLTSGIGLNRILSEKIQRREGFYLELTPHYRKINLGRRQSQCLFYTLNGLSAKEIGDLIHISSRTVESHLNKIKEMLGCRTKTQLFEKAMELGLLNFLIT